MRAVRLYLWDKLGKQCSLAGACQSSLPDVIRSKRPGPNQRIGYRIRQWTKLQTTANRLGDVDGGESNRTWIILAYI